MNTMNKIDPSNITPLYKQLYNVLLQAIKDGTFQPGDKIPSEDKLQEQFGISRVTVRNALQLLVDDEVLLRIHGKGTFVADGGFSENPLFGGSFTDTCLRLNVKPSTHIILCTVQPARLKASVKLGLDMGEEIIHIQRLRLVDGIACILEHDYFPRSFGFLLKAELENKSLFSLLKKKGFRPDYFEDYYEIWYAPKKDAALLKCDPGTALLRVDQLIFSGGRKLY
ncbi:MAG: GntR family transcriptional regulator, partial [Spirochaetaceae bacterium]|nr:GntR family transcriptional regulator [Spirochaetaceae bacterium]